MEDGKETSSIAPSASVIVPLYDSEATLPPFLASLRQQRFRDFEAVLVDSSPGAGGATICADYPEFRYQRSHRRLWPQEARALGVACSRGELLVFTDPDVLLAPDWLERLISAHRRSGLVTMGAIACHGQRWLDRGIHLCKFSKWLPGRPARHLDMAPTVNLLCPRKLFEAVGGFRGDPLLGDAQLSWDLRQWGEQLQFTPLAIVEHHHLQGFRSFVHERWERGIRYGSQRHRWLGSSRGWSLYYLTVTLLPLRLLSNLFHCARHAASAGMLRSYLTTFPVILVGFAASLAGEATGHAQGLTGRAATA